MNCSANEVMMLAAKAARGAGAPPAQAARFGVAAAAHLMAGRDDGVLGRALAALPKGAIIELPLAINCIEERAEQGRACGALHGFERSLVQSYVSTLPYTAALNDDDILRIDLTKPAQRTPVQRIDLCDEIYLGWAALAARILVPESAASRQSGAGAGLSDND
ncbi:hypothetical protein OS189_14480 [Sulfitobacter sp. F26169L]|uniref:hypothetical protein n=1 Tax=Sulfitobacter sp. F26169L TaxID=2996015 RepID=UPI002260BE3E|nr:hypothetical protein [Sulfitobacter sp. F26169L]MCX7567549.1 hypothetical protein [Sulfitobacter sp. F26169L]